MKYPNDVIEMTALDRIKYIIALEMLLSKADELIESIPECPIHGTRCIPHAIKWVKDQKSKIGG